MQCLEAVGVQHVVLLIELCRLTVFVEIVLSQLDTRVVDLLSETNKRVPTCLGAGGETTDELRKVLTRL
jgi:hypothetical protein